jgi:CRISPR/Cas system CMR subunit Cmr4 (Cas7 group RAMP superfamily)
VRFIADLTPERSAGGSAVCSDTVKFGIPLKTFPGELHAITTCTVIDRYVFAVQVVTHYRRQMLERRKDQAAEEGARRSNRDKDFYSSGRTQ